MSDFSAAAKRVQLNVRIPEYLKRFLQDWATEEKTSMSDLLLRVVHQEMQRRIIREETSDVESI